MFERQFLMTKMGSKKQALHPHREAKWKAKIQGLTNTCEEQCLCLAPPVPVAETWDEVDTLLQSWVVTAICGVHLVQLPLAAPDDPRGPWGLSTTQGCRLLRTKWAKWLACLWPQCLWIPLSL